MQITKATKKKAKLRAAIFGPSGSGKTFSSLGIAKGLANGGEVVVIDSERGSASKYADHFDFNVLEPDGFDVSTYVEAISMCGEHDVLVIDSMTHAWRDLLEEIDKLAKAKYQGNTWAAWSEGTPKQRKLVDALLTFPGHIIATMRSKTEWTSEKGKDGTTRPVRVGLAPEQGKGIEYEFDLLLELSPDHIINVLKDRTGKFQDKLIEKPGEDFGREMLGWLNEGADPPPPPTPQKDKDNGKGDVAKGLKMINALLKDRKFPLLGQAGIELTLDEWLNEQVGAKELDALTYDQTKTVYRALVSLEGGG